MRGRRSILVSAGVLAVGLALGAGTIAVNRLEASPPVPHLTRPTAAAPVPSASSEATPSRATSAAASPALVVHPISGSGIGFDVAHDETLLIAPGLRGQTMSAYLTWSWDGAVWHYIGPAPGAGDVSSNLVYDPAIGRTVALVGCTTGCAQSLWGWDGSTWAILDNPTTVPGAGGQDFLAFDEARHDLVLYQTAQSATWIYDGRDLTQASTGTRPPNFVGGSMAYDPRTRTVLLYGLPCYGAESACQLNETWEWDGSSWSQAHPRNSPSFVAPAYLKSPSSVGPAYLAYDAHDATMILVALQLVGPGWQTSTWAWDGTNWTQLHPQRQPKDVLLMAYDQKLQEVVILDDAFAPTATFTYAEGEWHYVSKYS